MEALLTTPQHFRFLKDRWSTMSSEYRQGIDVDLIPFLDLINQHPSLVSVMSCAAHADRKKYDFYVHFAVRDLAGLTFLSNLYATLRTGLMEHILEKGQFRLGEEGKTLHHPGILTPRKLRLTHLAMGIPTGDKQDKEPSPDDFYNATTLAVSFSVSTIRREHAWLIEHLQKVTELMFAQQQHLAPSQQSWGYEQPRPLHNPGRIY